MNQDRRLIFVSHANPQDNYATLWICSRLAAAGYEVWSDLTQLIGGELFWKDIQEAIRTHAAKVIFLVSHSSAAKDGFLNELSIASGTERTEGLSDFLIPCRLDDIPHNDLPAQLHRRNAIEFSGGWHRGLGQLIVKLQKDNVPRKMGGSQDEFWAWSKAFLHSDAGVIRNAEKLYSSWISVPELPSSIRIHRRNPGHSLTRQDWNWPVVPFGSDLLLSFAASNELSDATATQAVILEKDISLDVFQETTSNTPLGKLSKHDVSNVLVDLTRQAWDRFCERRRLFPFELASGQKCWYMPLPSSGIERHLFVDMHGKNRKKALIGRSDKYDVFWHLAVQAHPVFGTFPRLGLSLHIIFTSDGKTPLVSAKRMHRLRRTFCKNWWQWQWRDLLLVFLAWCTKQTTALEIPVSGSRSIRAGARPMVFNAPVSTPEAQVAGVVLEEPLEAEDLTFDWLDQEEEPVLDSIEISTDLIK